MFKGSPVTPALMIALSRVFADLGIHPVYELHTPGQPELITLTSDPASESGTLLEVDGEQCGAWLPWHKDLVFTHKINHGGLLHAVQIPSRGGATGFVDQIGGYDSLPEAVKARIDGLNIVYRLGRLEDSPYATEQQVRYLRESTTYQATRARAAADFPAVVHPLVYSQAETGRKVLNLSPRYAQAIVEMPGAEGDELLRFLSRHLPEGRSYFHQWQPDEMVLWDNWRMCSTASRPRPLDEVRVMQRTTLIGDYGFGRKLDLEAAA